MRDIEHPDITRVNLTGYPQAEPVIVDRCPQCHGDIFAGEYVVIYDDYRFCSESCLIEYLVDSGIVERAEVGV